jgi:hypothetical protein
MTRRGPSEWMMRCGPLLRQDIDRHGLLGVNPGCKQQEGCCEHELHLVSFAIRVNGKTERRHFTIRHDTIGLLQIASVSWLCRSNWERVRSYHWVAVVHAIVYSCIKSECCRSALQQPSPEKRVAVLASRFWRDAAKQRGKNHRTYPSQFVTLAAFSDTRR